jgi:hypothetical protein
VFIILRLPLPGHPASYPCTRQLADHTASPGEAVEADGPPQETTWSAAGLRGIFVAMLLKGTRAVSCHYPLLCGRSSTDLLYRGYCTLCCRCYSPRMPFSVTCNALFVESAVPITADRVVNRPLVQTDFHRHEFFEMLFKHATGTTLLNYLTGLRIEQACLLLRDTCDNITDVCYFFGRRGRACRAGGRRVVDREEGVGWRRGLGRHHGPRGGGAESLGRVGPICNRTNRSQCNWDLRGCG